MQVQKKKKQKKLATDDGRLETSNRQKARENVKPAKSAGKHITSKMREKTYYLILLSKTNSIKNTVYTLYKI